MLNTDVLLARKKENDMMNPVLACVIILLAGGMLGIPCAWYVEASTWGYFIAPPIGGTALLTMFLALWNAQDRPQSRTALVVLVCTVSYWIAPFVAVFIARTLTATDPETAAILFRWRFYIWLIAPPVIACAIVLMHHKMQEQNAELFYSRHKEIARPTTRRSILSFMNRSGSL